MSDQIPTPDDALDELVSAVLDGEADPDERARVEADPDLRRRLEELRSVRDRVAEPVAGLDEVTALRLRTRALAETAARASSSGAPPASSRWSAWLDPRRLAATAAVLVLVALAVPIVRSFDGDGADRGDDAATAAFDDADESMDVLRDGESMPEGGAGSADATDGGSAGAVESSEAAPAELVDLGDADSDEELAARAEEVVERGSSHVTSSDTTGYSPRAHLAGACLDDDGGEVVATFVGRSDRAERIVVVLDDGDAMRTVVHDATTCEVVAERP